MNRNKIVIDSSGDLYPGHPNANFENGFESVPLKIIINDTEYIDDAKADVNAMLAHMKANKGPSSSACPSIEEYSEAFRDADRVICVTVSGGLSGSYNAALTARKLVLEEHPEKEIHVVDSHATSGVVMLIARYADKLLSEDLSFEEIVKRIDEYSSQVKVIFALSCYDNLIKAGRMSKTAGLVATALNIRAIAHNTPEGQIEVLDKVRGEKKALEKIVELMAGTKELRNTPIIITHSNNEEGADAVAELLRERHGATDITITTLRCLCTYYSDNKSVLVSF